MSERRDTGARRVLHLIDSLGLGGAQTVLQTYLDSGQAGAAVHAFVLRRAPDPVAIAHSNVAVAASSSRFSLRPILELRRIVMRRRIEILHCHLFRAQVIGFLVKRLFFPRTMLVFHEHGRVVGREGESWLEAWAFRTFLRFVARHVDRFVCISETTLDALLTAIPSAQDRAFVVHNPIRSAPPADQIDRITVRQELGVPEHAFAVGFGARLVERKGWQDFLDALAQLPALVPLHFLLAGDGTERANVAAHACELGLQSSGRLLGRIVDMRRFYPALDCFVAPAHWEPHGLSHLEAQSYGVPVVVTDVPGMRDTVHAEVDALVCPARNAAALAGQILRIARDDELRRRLSEAGRANAAEFTVDAFATGLERAYARAGTSEANPPWARTAGAPASRA